jgi:CheY-like chemotaxis protein
LFDATAHATHHGRAVMDSQTRPHVLVFRGPTTEEHPLEEALGVHCDVDAFDSMAEAVDALRSEQYHAVFADAGDFLPLERAVAGAQSNQVLNAIGEGVLIVDREGRCSWTNERMRGFTSEVIEQTRRICYQALAIFASEVTTDDDAGHSSKKFTCQVGDRFFEMVCSPVIDNHHQVQQVVAVVWDATSTRRLQTKIDAIDAAGRELARIHSNSVSDLSPSDRLKLLQDKIIRYSKDLMHFDHFAIRLLDKRTNKLEVVIAEGLPPQALEIDLYARPEGNGISGYVAATGRSYICHDTEKDPRYVMGLRHSKSSLTVPLMLFDEVVGVYNIESEQAAAFTEDDRQFAEIFGRYVALALNILDLLVVERYTTSGQVTDSVVQEMAEPLNDIQVEAQSLKDEYLGDESMRDRLARISENVDAIRSAIQDVKAGPRAVLGTEQVEGSGDEQDAILAGKRVLVADDEPNIRKTITDMLRKHGCEVAVCKDGYEACQELENGDCDFDLVVSDIKMPYRNGYEIFAATQRYQTGAPVVLMTGFGYDPHHSIVRASQEGLSSVLFKPFKAEQLIEELHKALGAEPESANPAQNDSQS